jgi:hypothetical protein
VLGLSPRLMVLRGSKTLASDDWMGQHFVLRYRNAQAVLADLEAMHVDFLILDSSPESNALPYWQQIHDMVDAYPERVALVFSAPIDSANGPLRPLSLYRITSPTPGPAKSFDPNGVKGGSSAAPSR